MKVDPISKSLTVRYLIALLLTAIFITSGQVIIQKAITSQEEDAHTINISGRQRMLSQKLSKDTVSLILLARTKDTSKNHIRQRLRSTKSQLNETYEVLYQSLPKHVSHYYRGSTMDALKNISLAQKNLLDFAAQIEAESLSGITLYTPEQVSLRVSQLTQLESEFLNQMENIVFLYEASSRQKDESLRSVELLLYLAALFMLLIEAVVIFRPAISRLSETLTRLAEKQREVEAVNLGLEQRIKERTEQLEIEKEKANKANEAKSDFLAYVSHEIRTPLTSIIGLSQLLQESSLSSEQRKLLEKVHVAGNNLLKTVNTVLDLSKIEAGQLKLESHPFSISEICMKVYDMLNNSAERKGLKFNVNVDPKIESVIGDAHRLEEILINLCYNAIKFTAKGSVDLHVELRDDKIHFSIRDTGPGIPKHKLPLLFKKFNQTDTRIWKQYGGTGLGLSISKNLVELMGGEIKVESELNVGTSFSFSIPYQKSELDILESVTAVKDTRLPARNIRILLAEDNMDSRMIINYFLKDTSFKIIEVEDGSKAVAKFKEQKFDLVLMDMQMPEMDGYEATRAIRQWESQQGQQHVPIVALTAHSLSTELEKSFAAGCDSHLSKPVDKETLLDTLTSIVS